MHFSYQMAVAFEHTVNSHMRSLKVINGSFMVFENKCYHFPVHLLILCRSIL